MSPASTVNMASSPPKPQITSGSAVAFEGLKPGCSTVLEAAPIGWQLFVLESGKSASIAFLPLLATDATRLLAQALSRLRQALSIGLSAYGGRGLGHPREGHSSGKHRG